MAAEVVQLRTTQSEKAPVYTDIERRLNAAERRELIRRFGQRQDVPFDITEQHPILQMYYSKTAPILDARPQTIITPFLPALACNIGNHAFVSAFGKRIFCNIWTIIIGPSSIGRKSTAIDWTLPPLFQYDEECEQTYNEELRGYQKQDQSYRDATPAPVQRRIILPSSSAEGFLRFLAENPSSLITYNEIASFLSKLGKSYNADLKADLVDWFDSPARRTKQLNRDDHQQTLRYPAFSISVASTLSWLIQNMKPGDLESGFMQRFLMCQINKVEFDSVNCRWKSGTAENQHCTNWLAQVYHGLRLFGFQDHPLELHMSEEAINLHEKINRAVLESIFLDQDDLLFTYWSRIFTGYFGRLCILFTLCEHVLTGMAQQNVYFDPYETYSVSERTASYALKLCQFYFQNVRTFLSNEAHPSVDANEKKVLQVFYNNKSEDYLTRSFLLTYTRLKKMDLDAALLNLEALHLIGIHFIQEEYHKTKRTPVYRLLLP